MKSFFEFWEFLRNKPLNEAYEEEEYEMHPDISGPEGSSTHEIRRMRHKGSGETYWSKAAASDLQTINEYLAWRLYKLFGVKVADKADLWMDKNNTLRVTASQVSGKQLPLGYSDDPKAGLAGTDIHKGFFVDTFLGHWDVVGNVPRSNLFVDDDNTVVRIDLGGLGFRAMGARKAPATFGPEVGELQSMGEIGGPAPFPSTSKDVFSGIAERKQELQEAAAVFKKVSWEQIDDVINQVAAKVSAIAQEHNKPDLVSESNEYLEEIRPVLKSRFADMHKKLQGLGL
jgi:hypothetical protein